MMKVYVVEYRFWDTSTNQWISKVSQEGYSSYEKARCFCTRHAGNAGVTSTPMYFQSYNNGLAEEFYIHEVNIV